MGMEATATSELTFQLNVRINTIFNLICTV